ncbi:translation initiation factor IF-2-like [Vidua chalybeata]|uniref:translation initiation factor IF-2-like n=1 Tax=Vidua chalybeata TaxID=81927 RepID=UPI0023A8DE9C|nr:translation initiation factor IF-2-like [Vidua chalybeata]
MALIPVAVPPPRPGRPSSCHRHGDSGHRPGRLPALRHLRGATLSCTHQHPPAPTHRPGWHRPRPEPGWQPPVRPHSRFRGSGDRGQRRVPAAEGHQRSPSRELFPLHGPAAPLLPGAAARGGRGPQGRGAGRAHGASCPHGRLHRGGHRRADVCPWPGPLLGAQRGCWRGQYLSRCSGKGRASICSRGISSPGVGEK